MSTADELEYADQRQLARWDREEMRDELDREEGNRESALLDARLDRDQREETE